MVKEKKIKCLLKFLLEKEECPVHAVLSCRLHTIACAALKSKKFKTVMNKHTVNTERYGNIFLLKKEVVKLHNILT